MKRVFTILLSLMLICVLFSVSSCTVRTDIDLTNSDEDEIYAAIEKTVSGENANKNIKIRGMIKFTPSYPEYRYFEIKDQNLFFITEDGKYPVSGSEVEIIVKYKDGEFKCLELVTLSEPDEFVDLDISEYDEEYTDSATGYILTYLADFEDVYIKLRGVYIKEGTSNLLTFNGSENTFDFISRDGIYPDRGSEIITIFKVEKNGDSLTLVMQSFEYVEYTDWL